jgi:hypothetical protein
MSRAAIGPVVALLVIIATGCIAAPEPSSLPPAQTATPSASFTSSALSSSSPIPTVVATATPEPSATVSASPVAGDLPAEIGTVAWVRRHLVLDAAGNGTSWRIVGGPLGHPATVKVDLPFETAFATTVGGSWLAIATIAKGTVSIDIRDVGTGAAVRTISTTGAGLGRVVFDPDRGWIYAQVTRAGGGYDVDRMDVGSGSVTKLLSLDKRFTPLDGIPTERAEMVLDPGGTLVIDACASADGCRLWEIPPGGPAPKPRTLPKATPIVCRIVGATDRWLVVLDDSVCFIDTGDAPMPLRAIDRRDGSSHIVTNEFLLSDRVVEFEGGTYVVSSLRSRDWSTSAIVTVDVESGGRVVHARGLSNPQPDLGPWLGVSATVLPGSWVLVAPWGGETTDDSEPQPARLLDLSTDEIVVLPAGTFGID